MFNYRPNVQVFWVLIGPDGGPRRATIAFLMKGTDRWYTDSQCTPVSRIHEPEIISTVEQPEAWQVDAVTIDRHVGGIREMHSLPPREPASHFPSTKSQAGFRSDIAEAT